MEHTDMVDELPAASPHAGHGHGHPSHGDVVKRLNRAKGHLASIVTMIEEGRPCLDLAQQLHAVESAVRNAKQILIHDHIDHCLADAIEGNGRATRQALVEFKTLAKYL